MDLVLVAQDALAFFQQIEPGVSAAFKVGSVVATSGTAAVQVLQKGKALCSYLIKRSPKSAPGDNPETLAGSAVSKEEVAILVDINRRMLSDVARYLDQQGIDADIVIVTNDPAYSEQVKFLNPDDPAEWDAVMQEFKTAMYAIKRSVGGVRFHIFLSTTLAQAFAFGAAWGTVDEATVYHWEKQTYRPAVKISREKMR